MINVVADADVLSKELFAHAFVKAGALVLQGGGGEIVKKKPDEIEHGRGFEDYRVTSRRKLARVDGKVCFLASSRRQFVWIEHADVSGGGFGPARRRVFLRGDGNLGVRFAIGRKKASRIAQSGLALPARVDSSRDLASLDGQVTGAPDRPGALFGVESGGPPDGPVSGAGTRTSGQRAGAGGRWRACREGTWKV